MDGEVVADVVGVIDERFPVSTRAFIGYRSVTNTSRAARAYTTDFERILHAAKTIAGQESLACTASSFGNNCSLGQVFKTQHKIEE